MAFVYGLDHLEPAFSDRPVPYISYGLHFDEACKHHIENTFQASRVYIIASRSLSSNTSALKRLQDALGDKVVGVRIGMTPHTHWNEVLEVAQDAAPKDPDCIVTLGAGSLTDAAKVVSWMLANDITTSEGMEKLSSATKGSSSAFKPPKIRHIAIPTSLSGGEYQARAGVTRDDGSDLKRPFFPPPRNPSLVVLDPELTTTTPQRIWLSTGVRAVDHCVETLCSLLSNPSGDADAEKGLLKLVPSLIRTHRDPGDLDARFESMRGVTEAMSAVSSGVPLGASHGIGHQLGPLGVGHGETSCILLPAVCKWNARAGANVERQEYCKNVLLRSPVVKEVLLARYGSGEHNKLDGLDLGDVLDAIFRDLGMPRTLKDVGVGRDKLDALAENSLRDHWCQTNAKPLTEKAQVLELLETVVE
ncbi:alcohol dehydrogenase [Capronia coronata CBS 617.96]|uniref:Alcohol dehydrogenase n=1 Tax=Capronia coronata CBS 617.96 TaxID=1182541 RepID=W9Y191_9EURO|nr:alcohol dehydrogenase [Capronia coronata CBS 617.96]EXJ86258.1 alcohol dehydrogenase [Capronia coronata CBS 617.96]